MSWEKISVEADIVLGEQIEKRRLAREVTRKQLGKVIKVTLQQIEKYEKGIDRVPMARLEIIGEFLDARVQKRIVRRISNLRKLESETGEIKDELVEIYSTIFDD